MNKKTIILSTLMFDKGGRVCKVNKHFLETLLFVLCIISLCARNGMQAMDFHQYPLHKVAAQRDNEEEEVKRLLESNADANQPDSSGNIPLHNAAANGNEIVVRLLLLHKANISQQNNGGETPLHEAAKYGYEVTIKTLLHYATDLHNLNPQRILNEERRHVLENLIKAEALKRNATATTNATARGEDETEPDPWAVTTANILGSLFVDHNPLHIFLDPPPRGPQGGSMKERLKHTLHQTADALSYQAFRFVRDPKVWLESGV